MKVGVFDSGVGGLTVLKELVNKYPNNHYIYYGDTKNIPYGDKSLDELKLLVGENVNTKEIICLPEKSLYQNILILLFPIDKSSFSSIYFVIGGTFIFPKPPTYLSTKVATSSIKSLSFIGA